MHPHLTLQGCCLIPYVTAVVQHYVVVTMDTLYLVFSAFGEVQKIATFEKNAGFQALVQYADISVADQVGNSCCQWRFC